MSLQLIEPALHAGIVTEHGERMLDFYTRILGLEPAGEVHFPGLGVVNKLQCGHSQLKILVLEQPARSHSPGGGFSAATGYRYISLNIRNIDTVVQACEDYGCSMVAEITEIRPGVKAAMLEDPDGNAIEFMQLD